MAQHLRAWSDYRRPGLRLFYWRTSAGSEVDFILYGKDLFWAVEVKNGRTVHPQDLRPLKAFGEDYPGAKRFLLYRGNERFVRDGIAVMPCVDFLLGLE